MEFFKTKNFVWLSVGTWLLLVFFIAAWKYDNNLFNGLDLAIYNQTINNSLNGKIMGLSIHPHSYFGDHFEPILFFLMPFYYLAKHALTLVLLQTIILAVTAWPIYKLAQKYLNNYWPTVFALSWLLNPFVHTAAFFEFHALTFSACLLVWALYFYKYEKFWLYFITLILVLLTREDAALSVMAFSAIALFEKKHWRWYLPAFVLAIIYFIVAMKTISYFSPENHYKFISYYQWLGATQKEIIINALTQPWLIVSKLFRFQNVVLFLTLLMPTGFVAFYRPKWLLLSLPAFLGYALTGSNSATIILVTHYAIILLPGFYLASIISLKHLLNKITFNNVFYLPVIKIIFAVSLVYSLLTIGLGKALTEFSFLKTHKIFAANNHLIKKNESVIAPFSLLTFYSNRELVYSLKYLLTGHKQLSSQPFIIPPTDWLIIDNQDMIYFSATNPATDQWKMWWDVLDDNIRNRANSMFLTKLSPTIAYFSNQPSDYKLVEVINKSSNNLTATALKQNLLGEEKLVQLSLSCGYQNNNQVIHVKNLLNNNKISEYDLPFLWGFYRSGECDPSYNYHQLIALPSNTVFTEISINNVKLETKINTFGVLTTNSVATKIIEKVDLSFK